MNSNESNQPREDSPETPEGIRASAKNLAASVRNAAGDAASQLKDQAAGIAQERKSRLAERIGQYSSSIDKNASAWEQEDPNIAWLTHKAANRLKEASDYLRESDFARIKEDAEEVSRTHPALFFGGLFLLGVVAGNLLKATAKSSPTKTRRSEPVPYPAREDVTPVRDEMGTWPEIPESEAVK